MKGSEDLSRTVEFTLDLDDGIRIGDEVVIRLSKINKLQARLQISAPRQVHVWRAEIYRKIKQGDTQ
jgi:carbon storage regulator CsrA